MEAQSRRGTGAGKFSGENVMMKPQAPTSNIKRNTKPQTPIGVRSGFCGWNLDVLWSLEFGAWNF
jgi:hypothetical protein